MFEFNLSGTREANLVGGPKDGEILMVKEDDHQVSFFSARIDPSNSEKVEYREHTYVRDPDSFAFVYAGSVPVSEERTSGRS